MTDNNHSEEEQDDQIIGIAFRWSMIIILFVIVVGTVCYQLFINQHEKPIVEELPLTNVDTRTETQIVIPKVNFTDVTTTAGITYQHTNGLSDEKLLPETMGGGCAFLDYDNDDDQDILFVNSTYWPWEGATDSTPPPLMQLYQNDGKGNFINVTAGSGLEIECYGMGAACGDFDNDGLVDIYISTLGKNLLFHNQGSGKFKEIGKIAEVAGDEKDWSTSCGWFDFDNDGDLDLYVGNYLDWTREYDTSQNFQLTGVGRSYGRPMNFSGAYPYLYENQGDGTFTEIAEKAGLYVKDSETNASLSKALGVTFADVDQDGWMDILVANDTVQNLLFQNQGDRTFIERGDLAGIAFDENGKARGAMGIDIASFRNENSLGIAIGNFANEMTALYVSNNNDMLFNDEAMSTGLGPVSRLKLTFGLFFFDYDFDGLSDIFATNGHLDHDINRVQESQHYEQSPQLFRNCGAKSETEFLLLNVQYCGTDLTLPVVGRGASFADIDGDADLDILISTLGGKPRLLRNELQSDNQWVRFKLEGTSVNRDAIGSLIELHTTGGIQKKQVMPTRSYLSQVELPVTFGIGSGNTISKAVICWSDGTKQTIEELQPNQTYKVKQK